MNKDNSMILARRYAQAFMNVYRNELTPTIRQRLQELHTFLRTHNHVLFFLSTPSLSDAAKRNGIYFLIERFTLPESVNKIVTLLMNSRRLFLLKYFLDALEELYQKEHNISFFEIRSSHALSIDQRTFLRDFLKACSGRDIMYKYVRDPRLIAGIRMCSKTHLWEYSIAAQLRAVQVSLIR